jgi:hypothetical protein
MHAERDKTPTSATRAWVMKAPRDDPFQRLALGVRFGEIRSALMQKAKTTPIQCAIFRHYEFIGANIFCASTPMLEFKGHYEFGVHP